MNSTSLARAGEDAVDRRPVVVVGLQPQAGLVVVLGQARRVDLRRHHPRARVGHGLDDQVLRRRPRPVHRAVGDREVERAARDGERVLRVRPQDGPARRCRARCRRTRPSAPARSGTPRAGRVTRTSTLRGLALPPGSVGDRHGRRVVARGSRRCRSGPRRWTGPRSCRTPRSPTRRSAPRPRRRSPSASNATSSGASPLAGAAAAVTSGGAVFAAPLPVNRNQLRFIRLPVCVGWSKTTNRAMRPRPARCPAGPSSRPARSASRPSGRCSASRPPPRRSGSSNFQLDRAAGAVRRDPEGGPCRGPRGCRG